MANLTTTINVNIPQLDELKRLIEHLELVIAQTPQANIELENEPLTVSEPVQETKEVTLEETQCAMYEAVKKHGKDNVKKLLAEFGVEKVSAVKPADRAKLIERLETLGGE